MGTAAFSAFMDLYHAVLSSPVLTLAEKTSAIEAAYDEFAGRVQPPAFAAIAKRLAATPPREPNAETQSAAKAAAAPQGGSAKPVAARNGRSNPRVS